jgi:hypothetical protein
MKTTDGCTGFQRSRIQPSLAGASQGVRVGSTVEDQLGFTRQSCADWLLSLSHLAATM